MSSGHETEQNASPRKLSDIAKDGAIALVLAVIVNVVVTTAAQVMGIGEGLDPLTYPPVVILTAAGVIGGSIVYGILLGVTGNPDRSFAIIAAIVLLLSLLPDVTFVPEQPGGSLVAGIFLAVMHVSTAVIVVWRLVDWELLRPSAANT